MKIVQTDISQIDQLVELFDAYRLWYRKESDKKNAKDFLLQRIKNGESIIYACENEGGKLVGFTQLYPIFSSVRMKRMWLLNDLFVDPNFRGQDISKMLINQAQDLCRNTNACGILLETEKTNDIGNNLYPATGFELEENNFYFWIKS